MAANRRPQRLGREADPADDEREGELHHRGPGRPPCCDQGGRGVSCEEAARGRGE